jgi:hypothetical protein
MICRNRSLALAAAAALWLIFAGTASAARVVFHYAPTDLCGSTSLKPSGPCGAPGTRVAWFGMYRAAYACEPRPTHMVTFRHAYTGRNVTVPVTFPEGSPRIEYRADRIVYNYGSYAVEAHFLRDGSLDVVYVDGPFRFLETNYAY